MQYTKSQKLGWEHLTKDEKSALTLIVINERSKKEASTILNLSYYKFNELYSRARKMFMLFKEYYDQSETLVPGGLPLSRDQVLLLHFLLKDRKKFDTCADMTGQTQLLSYPNRVRFWDDLFNGIDKESKIHQNFINMIREFDRWNKFRILPKKHQISSPFLRRRNIIHKKIVKNLVEISPLSWELITQSTYKSQPPYFYIPKVSLTENSYGVIQASDYADMVKWVTQNQLPIFKSLKEAEDLASCIFDYESLERKPTHLAHRFWARFRVIITKAINFKDLYNLDLDSEIKLSLKDQNFMKKSKAQKSKKISIKPSRSGDFWL